MNVFVFPEVLFQFQLRFLEFMIHNDLEIVVLIKNLFNKIKDSFYIDLLGIRFFLGDGKGIFFVNYG